MATQEELRLEAIRKRGVDPQPPFVGTARQVNATVPEPTIQEKILLKKRQILDQKIADTKAAIQRTTESNAVRDSTNREPIQYQRPANSDHGGVLGLTGDDKRVLRSSPTSGTAEFAVETPDKFSHAEAAAAAGIDVTTGLSASIRTVASLIDFDPRAQKMALEIEIRKDLGEDFPAHESVMKRDEASGMAAYLRKQEDGSLRWTLINPPGTDVGDFLEFAGELPTLIMDIGGSVVGALASGAATGGLGTALGASAGAAIGGSLSIPLRIWLAKKAGIPQKVIDTIDIADEAKFQALMSGGGEILGHGLIGSVTSVRNFLGRPLDMKDIPALEAEIKKNLKIIRQTEEASGVTFTPTVGQLTNSTDLQVAEATLRGGAIGRTSRELKAADINNEKASAEALHNLATQEVRSPSASGFRSIEEISEEAQELLVKKELAEPASIADKAQTQVDDFNTRFAAASDREKLVKLQEISAFQKDEMRKMEKAAWELHRDVIEWDAKKRTANIGLDNQGETPIRTFMGQLRGDADGALMRSLAQGNEATLKSAGFGPDDVARMMEGGDPTGLAGPLLDTRHLHTTLSHLKRSRAQMQDGVNPNGFELNDLNGLIDAIELQMKSGSFRRASSGRAVNTEKAAQIRLVWDNANTTTELFHSTFDGDAMRRLLATRRVVENGRVTTVFDMPPGLVHGRLFKSKDARFLRDALEATGQDPQVRQGLADEFMKFVRLSVIRDGKVQQGAFNDLMSNYQDHMALILGPDNVAKITNLGSMGRVIDQMADQTQKITRRLSQAYGRTIAEPTNPINIAEEILSSRLNSRQATNLMNDLRRMDIRLATQVEEKVMERVFILASKGDKTVVGFQALDNLLIAKRDTLQAVGGRRYVRDLDNLRDTLGILARKRFSRGAKSQPQTVFERATRLFFGPLGREQRFISAIARSARANRAGTVAKLLSNPGALRQYARLKNMSIRDPRFWVGAQLIGDDIFDVFIDMAPNEYKEFLDGTLRKEESQRQEPF